MDNTNLPRDGDLTSNGGILSWEKIQFSADAAFAMDVDERQLSSDLENQLRLTTEIQNDVRIGQVTVKKEPGDQPCMFTGQAGPSSVGTNVFGSVYNQYNQVTNLQYTGTTHFVRPESQNIQWGQNINVDSVKKESLSSFDLEMDREPSITPFKQVVPTSGLQNYSKGSTQSTMAHQSNMASVYGQERYPNEDKLRRYEGEPRYDATNLQHQMWQQQQVQQPPRSIIASPTEDDVSMVTEELYTFELDDFGDGPLHTLTAVTDQNILASSIEMLLKCGVVKQCINLQNKLKQTPLFLAVLQKNIPMVSWLLDNGADPNIQGTLYIDRDEYIWRSPLHIAAMSGDEWLCVINLILTKGSNTNINLCSHGDRLSALHLALKHHTQTLSCRQVIMDLINKGSDVSLREQSSSKTPFMLALETRDLSLVQDFLNKFPADRRRAILQEQARSGDTCLHIAAGLSRVNSQDKERLLRYLVTNGANGNVMNNAKEFPRDFARKEWDSITRKS